MIENYKIEAFSKPVSDLADSPIMSAGELKSHFDSNSYELLEALNGLIDCLCGENSIGEFKIDGESANTVIEEIRDETDKKADASDLESKADKSDIDDIYEQIGDIESALDLLCELQNQYIGGDEA